MERCQGRFDGQVVVVTGGARGIGDAIVRRVVAEGGQAVVPDVLDPDQPVARTRYLRCDITDRQAVASAYASIEAKEGRLDVLVNNAGIQRVALTDLIDPDDWDEVIRVNLTGAFNWSRLALRTMKRQRSGAIVNIGSVAGLVALPGRGPYTAAKAGLMALTRTMAVEVASLGIRVNAVAPGMTLSGMIAQVAREGVVNLDAMAHEIPMGRLATVDEVAKAVCFLASDDASYITGETLVVDGAWSVNAIRDAPEWLTARGG